MERNIPKTTTKNVRASSCSNENNALLPYQRVRRSTGFVPPFRFGLQDSTLFASTIKKLHCGCGAKMHIKEWKFENGCLGAVLSCMNVSCNEVILHEGSNVMEGMIKRKELPYRMQTAFVSIFGSFSKKFNLFFTLGGMQCPCDKKSFRKFNSEYIRPTVLRLAKESMERATFKTSDQDSFAIDASYQERGYKSLCALIPLFNITTKEIINMVIYQRTTKSGAKQHGYVNYTSNASYMEADGTSELLK